jgi:hypothetical protein
MALETALLDDSQNTVARARTLLRYYLTYDRALRYHVQPSEHDAKQATGSGAMYASRSHQESVSLVVSLAASGS